MRDWRRTEEKKRNPDSRPQTDRNMEALGTLAGGIAHQFNNALVGILGNIELLKFDFPDDEVLDKYVESMKTSVRRMTHLTGQLLAYARGGKYEPKIFSLHDFTLKALPSLLHDMLPEIRVVTDLQGDCQNLPPGPYICLIIEDDGKGMDKETKERIFEPFFTTKFQGRGLGMAAAYGIIKNHDGWISVNSEPDLGTDVHIYLPVVSAPE
jgi:signal transduction histidine kinase